MLLAIPATLLGQVHIGANEDPHGGAVLDLTNPDKLGLLLPSISLTNLEYLQVDNKTNPPTDADVSANGIIVYNKNANLLDGMGLYVWNGERWNVLTPPITPPVTPVVSNASHSFAGYNSNLLR